MNSGKFVKGAWMETKEEVPEDNYTIGNAIKLMMTSIIDIEAHIEMLNAKIDEERYKSNERIVESQLNEHALMIKCGLIGIGAAGITSILLNLIQFFTS